MAVTVERVQGGTGGVVAAPIAKKVLEALGPEALMPGVTRDTVIDGRYQVAPASARAAWPTSTAPRTFSSAATWRSSCSTGASPRTRSSSSASAARPRPRPGCSTRTSVQVYDRGEWDDTYYIAMEFLEGRSLKQIIREGGPLDPDRAIDITIQILRAERFAHKRGIVHRDIKPAQRDRRRRGQREGHGLRDRARRGVGHDRDRLDHRHRAVPLARAGAGARRVGALGPLLDRHPALRDADRPRAVRRRLAGDDRAQAGLRGARAAVPAQPGRLAGARGRGSARAGQGPGVALRRRR